MLKTRELNFFLFMAKVLPPIPTTSMSTADVQDFVAHVRGVMLEALYEMSPKVSSEKDFQSEAVVTEKVSTDNHQKESSIATPPESGASLVLPSIGVTATSIEP